MLSFLAAIMIHNLMPAFWKAYDAPAAVRVEQVKQKVVLPNLQFYADGEFYDNLSDDGIAAYLLSVKPNENAMRAKSTEVADELPFAVANVQVGLPNLDLSKAQFWILPSFNHFNGQTHDIPDGFGVFFGVDGIVKYGPTNFNVMVAHELFHIYQFQTHPNNDTGTQSAWQAAWGEGTAAYGSQALVKGATMIDALDATLANANAATTKSLACYLQKNWDSHSRVAINAMINAGSHPDGLPPRGGYLLGYLAAKEFVKSHSIAQLGAAPTDEAEAALKSTITQLCPN